MKKELHYVLTHPMAKVISSGNLKTCFIFTSLTHPDANCLQGSKLLYAFNSSLVSGLNENKK